MPITPFRRRRRRLSIAGPARAFRRGSASEVGRTRGRSQDHRAVCGRAWRGNGSREPSEPRASPPLRPDVIAPLEKVTEEMWPGVPVIPDMATGASDGVYTSAAGLPDYGISGEAIDRDDIRAHGKDERIRIESFYRAVDFYYRYLKAVTSEN